MTPTPVPVHSLNYPVEDDSILQPLRRCLGLMSIIFGAAELGVVILSAFAFAKSPYGMNQYSGSAVAQSFIAWAFGAAKGVILIVAGIQCLRDWRGRMPLLVAAWLGLALSAHALFANTYFTLRSAAAYYGANPWQASAVVSTFVLRSVPSVMFSVLSIILLNQRVMRQRFEATS